MGGPGRDLEAVPKNLASPPEGVADEQQAQRPLLSHSVSGPPRPGPGGGVPGSPHWRIRASQGGRPGPLRG